jgi:DNA-binding transcriptional LysR family regulator
MDLNHVHAFVRVVEQGSFTGAARALNLPKSSVSRSVSHLEKGLGVMLLQRTTRKLHLTDAGRLYFDKARAALGELEDAGAVVTKLGTEPRGTVRLTAPADMAALLLADIIGDYLRKHPKVQVELSLSSRRVDLVEEGIDLAVRAGPLGDSSLVARKVGTAMAGLYASPKYLRRKGRPRTAADLAEHECILYRAVRGTAKWELSGPRGDETVQVRGAISADDITFVHAAVLEGLGIGMLPMFRCASNTRQALERVLPELQSRGSPVHVVMPSVRQQTAAIASFREFLIERLLQVTWSDDAEDKLARR